MTSSTSPEIGAHGKSMRLLPYESSDRVRDDDGESFGKSRVSYAYERKMMMRQIARERRAKYLMRVPVPVVLHPHRLQVFEPKSGDARELGIRSYKIEVADRESFVGKQIRHAARKISVSLPFVSILRSTTTGEAR